MASIAMDMGDDYVDEEEEDSHEFISREEFMAFALVLDLTGYIFADLLEQAATANTTAIDTILGVGVVGASDDSESAAAAEALETAEAPSDDGGHGCPICLEEDDTAVWKQTPCGHRFHGRCVERWLHAKGSCPMCRRQLVATMPTAEATNAAAYVELVRTVLRSVISASHSQDGVNSTSMEEEEEELLG